MTASPFLLFLAAVGRPGRQLEFIVYLIEQVLGLLAVTRHVPLIGFLRGYHLFPCLVAQPLRGRKIRVERGGDVLLGVLSYGAAGNQKQKTDNDQCDSGLDVQHRRDFS